MTNTGVLPWSSSTGSRMNGRNAVTSLLNEYAAPAAVPRIAVGYESARYTWYAFENRFDAHEYRKPAAMI